jgi:hypothetical protein
MAVIQFGFSLYTEWLAAYLKWMSRLAEAYIQNLKPWYIYNFGAALICCKVTMRIAQKTSSLVENIRLSVTLHRSTFGLPPNG